MTSPDGGPLSTSTNSPDTDPGNDRALPPYEGRRESADVAPASETEEDGAAVGGARRPTEAEPGLRQGDPDASPRGGVASPSDEQPAAQQSETEPDEGSTGPAHETGNRRGEDFK